MWVSEIGPTEVVPSRRAFRLMSVRIHQLQYARFPAFSFLAVRHSRGETAIYDPHGGRLSLITEDAIFRETSR